MDVIIRGAATKKQAQGKRQDDMIQRQLRKSIQSKISLKKIRINK